MAGWGWGLSEGAYKAIDRQNAMMDHQDRRIAELSAKLAEAEESAAYLEQRRGGECDKCGSWVCPPLRCVGCMMKSRITPASDPTQLAADTVPILTRRAESAESQLAAAREECKAWRGFDNEPDTLPEYRDHNRLRAEMGVK